MCARKDVASRNESSERLPICISDDPRIQDPESGTVRDEYGVGIDESSRCVPGRRRSPRPVSRTCPHKGERILIADERVLPDGDPPLFDRPHAIDAANPSSTRSSFPMMYNTGALACSSMLMMKSASCRCSFLRRVEPVGASENISGENDGVQALFVSDCEEPLVDLTVTVNVRRCEQSHYTFPLFGCCSVIRSTNSIQRIRIDLIAGNLTAMGSGSEILPQQRRSDRRRRDRRSQLPARSTLPSIGASSRRQTTARRTRPEPMAT